MKQIKRGVGKLLREKRRKNRDMIEKQRMREKEWLNIWKKKY